MAPASMLFLCLAATVASVKAGKFRFVPLNEEQRRKLGGGHKGYGYFAQDGLEYCLELPNGDATRKNKLWINPCKPGKSKQLWKPDPKMSSDEKSFMIRSKKDDNMCIEVPKKKAGARLKINKCNKKKPGQKWVFDGDWLSPKNKLSVCVYPKNGKYRKEQPAVLVSHYDIPEDDSWDFVTDDKEFN